MLSVGAPQQLSRKKNMLFLNRKRKLSLCAKKTLLNEFQSFVTTTHFYLFFHSPVWCHDIQQNDIKQKAIQRNGIKQYTIHQNNTQKCNT
jgi:hypothetical protein